MNLNQLNYFVTLARVQHYTRAAHALMITQPTLSHSIAHLEEELGTQLFEKFGRKVVLTKYGEVFLGYAEQTLSVLDEGIRMLQMMTGEEEGRIDLGYIYTRGSEFVPGIVRDFMKLNQDRKIHFTFTNGVTKNLLESLKNKKLDVVFCSHVENEPDVDFFPVSEEELVAIVPAGHELENRNSVTIRELGKYPQVGFVRTSGLHLPICGLFEREGVKPEIVYEMEEDLAVAGMVAQGFGVAIIPNISGLKHMDVKSIPIENLDYKRYIYMAVLKERYLPPVCIEFINFMKENYGITLS